MGLSVNDQLTLLLDLLDEQSGENSATHSEYQQIARLVTSMLDNQTIQNHEVLDMLPQIYEYGKQGESASNVTDHITNNKQNIESWISAINHITLK
ncbi:YtzH-like family protein [Virgibacillus oceani]